MANLKITNVRNIGNGHLFGGRDQLSCTVIVPDDTWGVEIGEHENYVVTVGDNYGIGRAVRALIEAGAFEGVIAPFVPEPEAKAE